MHTFKNLLFTQSPKGVALVYHKGIWGPALKSTVISVCLTVVRLAAMPVS